MKKIICLILLLAFVLSACGEKKYNDGRPNISVAPSSDFKYKVMETRENEIILFKYLKDDECVSIPDEIDGKKVTTIGAYCFSKSKIKEVIIPDTVTEVRTYAFARCENLEKVYWSDNVTLIESYAFAYCPNLEKITIPKNLKKLGSWVFRACKKITSKELNEKLNKYSDGPHF